MTPKDLAAWLKHVHGADFPPEQLAGPASVAAGLNGLVRAAAAELPLEREPADFQRLYAAIADHD